MLLSVSTCCMFFVLGVPMWKSRSASPGLALVLGACHFLSVRFISFRNVFTVCFLRLPHRSSLPVFFFHAHILRRVEYVVNWQFRLHSPLTFLFGPSLRCVLYMALVGWLHVIYLSINRRAVFAFHSRQLLTDIYHHACCFLSLCMVLPLRFILDPGGGRGSCHICWVAFCVTVYSQFPG